MKEKKRKDFFVLIGIVIVIIIVLFATYFMYQSKDKGEETKSDGTYATTVFDKDSVMSINIIMSDADWEDMLDNAILEEYYSCNVEVNGVTYHNVGIRVKGNSSLYQVSQIEGTERYSFKLEFDHYIEGQTLDGLDKLCLNNNIYDPSCMKEYMSYDLLDYMDVATPLYEFASISRNGEYMALYLAVEGVEDSYVERNFGTTTTNLYKPEPMPIEMDEEHQEETISVLSSIEKYMRRGKSFGEVVQELIKTGGYNSVANLGYVGDSLTNYDVIWNSSVFDVTEEDESRVVTALKNISEQTDVETYLDVDEMLRYIAANVVLLNDDSYFGLVEHNYYLCEQDGQLSMLPWDYNLSFGGFNMDNLDASELVNRAIDSVTVSGSYEDRPMIAAALSSDEYVERYHEYLEQIIEGYFNNSYYEETILKIQTLIAPYVEDDSTSFCTYDEFNEGVEALILAGTLRAESIENQLNGEIPSLAEERDGEGYELVDASGLDLDVLSQDVAKLLMRAMNS